MVFSPAVNYFRWLYSEWAFEYVDDVIWDRLQLLLDIYENIIELIYFYRPLKTSEILWFYQPWKHT